jgi:rhamnogalacturonyl hydrolase YesR
VGLEFWCRAIGWYGMATIDVLEVIPASHPRRAALLTILRSLVSGLARVQDCIGTNVGSYSFYVAHPRATNDFHGLGAFLIMNEQLLRTGG